MASEGVDMVVYDDQPKAPGLAVRGDLDMVSVGGFMRWVLGILHLVSGVARRLVLDLRHVDFCSVTGAEALIEIARAAKDMGIELVVAASKAVRRILEVLAMTGRFRLVDDLGEAA